MSPSWRVVKPEIVGNLESWDHEYFCDGEDHVTKASAVRHGWEVYGHDDWLLLRLYDGKADRLFWMDDERDDFGELSDVANKLGLDLTHVARALVDAGWS